MQQNEKKNVTSKFSLKTKMFPSIIQIAEFFNTMAVCKQKGWNTYKNKPLQMYELTFKYNDIFWGKAICKEGFVLWQQQH